MSEVLDVAVVGSGPNGLAAAVRLAQAGCRVVVFEASATPGGGLRSGERTLPGFLHDYCAACHPMGVLSPFFQSLPLERYGLTWCDSGVSVAHPLDDRPAVLLQGSPAETAARLGVDGPAYRRLVEPLLQDPATLFTDLLAPLGWPRRPLRLARFGLRALWPSTWLGRWAFRTPEARALLAGNAAHSLLPLNAWFTSALGIVFLLAAHLRAWPVVRGGSQQLADALVALLQDLGGEVRVNHRIRRLSDLPPHRAVLFDTDPYQLASIADDALPARYRRRLLTYRTGLGAFKLDWALSGPIPWRDGRVGSAATVHLGGTAEELAASEAAAWAGRVSDNPFVLLVQQSALDPSRAPAGRHTGYAYLHTPPSWEGDATEALEAQVERFAPGFRERILARHVTRPADFQAYNPNYVGGAVTGGPPSIDQLFTRPVARLDPYRTPNPRIFLGSAATPPGGGVHGMAGYHAAGSLLRRLAALPPP